MNCAEAQLPGDSDMGPEDRGRALNASVLVLNRHFQAVRVITARHSFVLLFREVAEVIDIEDGQVQQLRL